MPESTTTHGPKVSSTSGRRPIATRAVAASKTHGSIAGEPQRSGRYNALMPQPEDKALVTGKHVIDAIRVLGEDRRAKMRAIEAKFVRDTGRPWSALRYFSTEEDADNTSVPVLRGAGLEPTGLGDFLGAFLGATEAACRQVIASDNVPPYGTDLVDDHHGTCWRVYNIDAYAKHTAKRAHVRSAAPVAADAP